LGEADKASLPQMLLEKLVELGQRYDHVFGAIVEVNVGCARHYEEFLRLGGPLVGILREVARDGLLARDEEDGARR